MNVMKLMVVALAGWINQQQEHRSMRPRITKLQNTIIEPELGSTEEGQVNCRERLGGLLRYYHRDAA